MNYDMFIAGAIGFAPAMLLMFYTLKNYTYPVVERPFFDDRKVFFMFAVGIIIGVIIAAVHYIFEGGSAESYILYAILFALLEELTKFVILNKRSFLQRIDTSFYGVTLGLGIGSTTAFGIAFFALSARPEGSDAVQYLILIVVAIGLVLMHGATATTIGVGSARGNPWPFLTQAIMVHLAFNLLLVPVYLGESPLQYISLSLAVLFAGLYYRYVKDTMIPEVVSEALSRMRHASKR
jgi:RsiW-degrading membrane proteinase PrsW (M82 family)